MAYTIRLTWRLPTKRRLLFLKDCAPKSPVPRREREREQPLRRPYEQERRTLTWPPTSSPRQQARAHSGIPMPRDWHQHFLQRYRSQVLKEGVNPHSHPMLRVTYFMPEIFKLFLSKRPIDCGKNEVTTVSNQTTVSTAHTILYSVSLLRKQCGHRATDQLGHHHPQHTLPGPFQPLPSQLPAAEEDPNQGLRTRKADTGRPPSLLSATHTLRKALHPQQLLTGQLKSGNQISHLQEFHRY